MPAPATTKIRGREGQLYYLIGTGTNTIFAHVTDIAVNVKVAEIDASDHATDGWEDTFDGLKKWTGTAKANFMQSGADEAAFYGALTGGTDLTLQFRPQDVTGGLQYSGLCKIVDWKHDSAQANMQTVDLQFSGRGALTLDTVTAGGAA